MSRPLRIEYQGAWYHIMNRGRRGEWIFSKSSDYETFRELLMAGYSSASSAIERVQKKLAKDKKFKKRIETIKLNIFSR